MKLPVMVLFVFMVLFGIVYMLNKPVDREAVENESFRLQRVAEDRNLTKDDLAKLDQLTSGDDKLHGETLEAEWMIDHNYSRHVAHSLNAIYWIAKDGKWLCPADSLSHVGIFLQFNETDMAQDAANEGQDTLPDWLSKVRSIKANNSDAYPDLDGLVALMDRIIEDMKKGDYQAAQADSIHLDEIGYC